MATAGRRAGIRGQGLRSGACLKHDLDVVLRLESRATVDAAGGCGWCGSRIVHWDGRGTLVSQLDHHRADIEELLRAESAR
jgi:hypothetical protein